MNAKIMTTLHQLTIYSVSKSINVIHYSLHLRNTSEILRDNGQLACRLLVIKRHSQGQINGLVSYDRDLLHERVN